MPVSDGVLFNTARGDKFADFFTIPVDATVSMAGDFPVFNSPSMAKSLRMKMKNAAGTGDFKGCFENGWETDFTVQLLSAFSSADVRAFEAGFENSDGASRIPTTFYGARIGSHPATAAQTFAYLDNLSAALLTDPSGGYVYSVGDTIRTRTRRTGNELKVITNYNGGADRVMTVTLGLATDAYELARLFSTPMMRWVQGHFKVTAGKVSVLTANHRLAVLGTSLAQSRGTTGYYKGYAQLLSAAHPGKVLVCGAPSATSADILGSLPDVLKLNPTAVLFECFANDVLSTIPLATTQDNVASMVSLCNTAGVVPLFLNAGPLNSTYSTAINSWLATTAYQWFDWKTILANGSGNTLYAPYESVTTPYTNDHIHFGDNGADAVIKAAAYGGIDAWLIGRGTLDRIAPQKPFACIPHPLGTIATGNELSSRPALHLGQFKDPGMVWKSSGDGNLWVRGDFGSSKIVSFCAMLSANAQPATQIRLRLGSTQAEVDGTAPYDSTPLLFVNPSITREDGKYHSHLDLPSEISARWWRIDITNHSGDFEAMALVLGQKLTFSNYYNNQGFGFGQEDYGAVEIGRYGVVDETSGIKLRTLAMDFGWMSDTDRFTKFQPLRDKIGTTGVAFWCFDPDMTVQRQDKTYFGWLRKPVEYRASTFKHDRWGAQFDIRSLI